MVIADGDMTYDFDEIERFVSELEAGADLVIGDRMDRIETGAMPFMHRYVGNPVLSRLLNRLYHTSVRDAHCGMRALRRDILPRLELRTSGMEFASEMVVRAAREKLDVRQIPIGYHKRGGVSKLSPIRDGWRHLRFLILHAPTYLFIVPAGAMIAVGVLLDLTVITRADVFGRTWDIHTMIAGSLLLVAGTQILALGACARSVAVNVLGEHDEFFERLHRSLRLEHGVLLGSAVITAGITLCAIIVVTWAERGFGSLTEERLAVLGATLTIMGLQVVFSSFLLSIITLAAGRDRTSSG